MQALGRCNSCWLRPQRHKSSWIVLARMVSQGLVANEAPPQDFDITYFGGALSLNWVFLLVYVFIPFETNYTLESMFVVLLLSSCASARGCLRNQAALRGCLQIRLKVCIGVVGGFDCPGVYFGGSPSDLW